MKKEASRDAPFIADFGSSCRKERVKASLALSRVLPWTTSIPTRLRISSTTSSGARLFRSFSKSRSSSITFMSVVRLSTCCLIVASCCSTLTLIVERT